MKQIIPILICLLLLTGCSADKTVIQGFSMDSSYRIEAEEIPKKHELAIKSYLHRIDSVFNAYQEDSLISQLNQNKSLVVSDSDEQILFDFIKQTLPYCNEYFDISIRPVSKLWDFKQETPVLPDANKISAHLQSVHFQNIELTEDSVLLKNNAEIEGGAAVKGFVCERVAEMLKDTTALIDIGGTVKTVGQDVIAGVKSPDRNGLLCSFTLPNGKAVATSGSYERNFTLDGKLYHHILNPKTGYPAETELVSVSVICDSAMEADILSTTLFAENTLRIPESNNVIYVTKDGMVYVSSEVQNFKILNDAYQVTTLKKE